MLGFPDILFNPKDAFCRLVEKQEATGAEIVLGLFKTDKPEKADMIRFDTDGRIQNILIKPLVTSLTYTWIIAFWTPVFTQFLHDFVENHAYLKIPGLAKNGKKELFIGDIVREAIHTGLSTDYVIFESGSFLDIGTPDDLANLQNISWIK